MTEPTIEPEETTEADSSPAKAAASPPQAPASPLIDRLTKTLVYDYSDRFAEGQVIATFHDSYALLAKTARITAFLPTLAERFTRERLDAYAQAHGMQTKRAPEILFVCVHNAGRSQMAAAFARYYGQTHVHIRTGGSEPGERIQPEVSHAMKEVGISLDEEFPKPLTDEVVAAADVVITMGCGDSCPYIPGRRYEDWPIADPAETDTDGVEAIRDDIDTRVRELLGSVLHGVALPELTHPKR
jgi:arsenate reductase (thioredoxin)